MKCEFCKKEIEDESEDRECILFWLDSEKYPDRLKVYHVHAECLDKRLRTGR